MTDRRALACMVAVATMAAVLAVAPAPASAGPESGPDVELLLGDDNVGAALGWTGLFDAGSVTEVLLARDDAFADALASGSAQGAGDRPLLLTPSDSLDGRVATELERLGATTVHILGGDAAVTPEVAAELEAEGYAVERHAGITRIDTAVAIAESFVPNADTAIVVRAFGSAGDSTQAFADSLAAGAWAADAEWPVLLTETSALPEPTRNALGDVTEVFVVGGTAAVSEGVFAELEEAVGPDGSVVRVAGRNRFETAVEVARQRGFDDAGPDQVGVVDGQGADAWADGFAAAFYGDLADSPIVLANGADLPPETNAFLIDVSASVSRLVCGVWLDNVSCASAAAALELPFALVDVAVLVLGGRRYPVDQFHREPAHVPYCDGEHWHSHEPVVYPLEARAATLTDPGDCGFGKIPDVVQTTATVSQSQLASYEARRSG